MCDDEAAGNDDRSTEPASSGEPETDGGSAELDSVLRALTNRRRRHVLYHLQDHDVSDLDDLASSVCRVEYDSAAITDERLGTMKTTLVHADLPALEEIGFIEYDHRSETIRYQPPSRLLETFLRICARIET